MWEIDDFLCVNYVFKNYLYFEKKLDKDKGFIIKLAPLFDT